MELERQYPVLVAEGTRLNKEDECLRHKADRCAFRLGEIIATEISHAYGDGGVAKYAIDCGFSVPSANEYWRYYRGLGTVDNLDAFNALGRSYLQKLGTCIDGYTDGGSALRRLLHDHLLRWPSLQADGETPDTDRLGEIGKLLRRHEKELLAKVGKSAGDSECVPHPDGSVGLVFDGLAPEQDRQARELTGRLIYNVGTIAGRAEFDALAERATGLPHPPDLYRPEAGNATARSIAFVDERRELIRSAKLLAPCVATPWESRVMLARAEEALLDPALFPRRSIAAVVTDVPYVKYAAWRDHTKVPHEFEATVEEQAQLMARVARILVEREIVAERFIWFCTVPLRSAHVFTPPLLEAFRGTDFEHDLIVWDKACGTKTGSHSTFRRDAEGVICVNVGKRPLADAIDGEECLLHSNIIRALRSKEDDERHFWKPLELVRTLVRLATYDGADGAGQVILDPFAGAGTTGVAAILCRRDFRLVECDPDQHGLALANVGEVLGQSEANSLPRVEGARENVARHRRGIIVQARELEAKQEDFCSEASR